MAGSPLDNTNSPPCTHHVSHTIHIHTHTYTNSPCTHHVYHTIHHTLHHTRTPPSFLASFVHHTHTHTHVHHAPSFVHHHTLHHTRTPHTYLDASQHSIAPPHTTPHHTPHHTRTLMRRSILSHVSSTRFHVMVLTSMSRRANADTSASVSSSGFVVVIPSFARRLSMTGLNLRVPS